MRRKMRAGGLVETDVRHDAAAEKRAMRSARAIEELIGDEKIERLQIVPQRADGADGNDPLRRRASSSRKYSRDS